MMIQSLARLSPRRKAGVFAAVFLLGAAGGMFVLHPINEFVFFHEHSPPSPSARVFVAGQLRDMLAGQKPLKTVFYALVGASLTLFAAALFAAMVRRLVRLQQLTEALQKDTGALIAQGEGPTLEFKSSFRWDYKTGAVSRALEGPVLKTIAGFLNSQGGTLVIGVADDGAVLGLEKDYGTLRRQDRDGFEQALTTAVARNLGADVCPNVQVVFHSHEAKDVCRVMVSAASRPVFLPVGDTPKLFVRTGGATRELNVEEAIAYRAGRWR